MATNDLFGTQSKEILLKEQISEMEDNNTDEHENNKKLRIYSVLYGVICGILVSFIDFTIKILDSEINYFLWITYRSILMQLIIVIILIKNRFTIIVPKQIMLMLFLNSVLFAGGTFLLILSLNFINIFLQGVVEKLKIIFGFTFSRIFLKIPISILDIIIGGVVLAGVIITSYFSYQNSTGNIGSTYHVITGVLCLVFMSAMHCIVGLTNNRLQDVPAFVIMFWQNAVGISIAAIGLAAIRPQFIFTWKISILILISTLLSLGYMYFLNRSLQFGNMGLVFLGESSNVLVAFILQVAYFKIIPNILGGVGAAIVLIGVVMSTFSGEILRHHPPFFSVKF